MVETSTLISMEVWFPPHPKGTYRIPAAMESSSCTSWGACWISLGVCQQLHLRMPDWFFIVGTSSKHPLTFPIVCASWMYTVLILTKYHTLMRCFDEVCRSPRI